MAQEEITATAVLLAVLQERIKSLEEHIAATDKRLSSLDRDRSNALKWGIMILGTAVMSMGGWIFHFITNKVQ